MSSWPGDNPMDGPTWTPGMPSDAPAGAAAGGGGGAGDDWVPPPGSDQRVGDSERQLAADELREHFTAGRINVDDFSARLGDALRAATAADLNASLRDLPPIPGHTRPWLHRPGPAPGMVPEWRPQTTRSSREIWWGLPAWARVVMIVLGVWLTLSLWPAWLVLVIAWLVFIRPHRCRRHHNAY